MKTKVQLAKEIQFKAGDYTARIDKWDNGKFSLSLFDGDSCVFIANFESAWKLYQFCSDLSIQGADLIGKQKGT